MSIYGATNEQEKRYDDDKKNYDALLLMSFGGPEGMEDVMPFLEKVTEGRNIPRERLETVAKHYYERDGISPINQQNRKLIQAIEEELKRRAINLPVYFGNRNWHPFVEDTVKIMKEDGVKNALAFMTSGFSCYSGCRQYRENVISALESVQDAPTFDKVRVFYNHPRFIEAIVDLTRKSISLWNEEAQKKAKLIFTAHSIPLAMSEQSKYVEQLTETARLVTEAMGFQEYILCYQSRSGPPQVPWLEPDISDVIRKLAIKAVRHVAVIPIGFISDHMEVINDLDKEARATAMSLGMNFRRVPTVGVHPEFIGMIVDLIEERMTQNPARPAVGKYPANHDICPVNCCRRA